MSQVKSDTKFMKKLKKFLKIRPRVKNINYNAKTGQTPKAGIGNKKMASFREDTAANKKLQQETKDPNKKTVTYKRVTSKNKSKYSDQHLKKDEKKKGNNKKSKYDLKAGKYFTYKGRRYKAGSVTARRAENQIRAKKRAQEMAKKRLANK